MDDVIDFDTLDDEVITLCDHCKQEIDETLLYCHHCGEFSTGENTMLLDEYE